jgi:tetratricopeptide (TPR) repeat protein
MNMALSGATETRAERRRQLARARRLARRAEELASAGRYDEAILCQSGVVSIRHDDCDAFFRLGLLHREARRIDPALAAFRSASALAPDRCEPREALIETLLEASQYDEAIREAKALLRLSKRNVFGRDVLSIAYLQTGRIDDALHMTTEMVRLDPLNPNHHFKRALLLQQLGKLGGAMDEYLRVRDLAAPGTELVSDASEAMDALDDFQLRQIMLLACDDRHFHHHLRMNAEEAVRVRGFGLSPDALGRIAHIAAANLDPMSSALRSSVWGGVKHYN